MKKSACIFILLTTILGACSTSKSSSVANMQPQPDANNATQTQTIVTKSGKNIPTSEAKMLIAAPDRVLLRKKPERTMEQAFQAATAKPDSI